MRQNRIHAALSVVYNLAFHPINHAILASVGKDPNIHLWDVETQTSIGNIPIALPGMPEPWLSNVCYSHNGRRVAVSSGGIALGVVVVWELEPPPRQCNSFSHAGQITGIALDPTGRLGGVWVSPGESVAYVYSPSGQIIALLRGPAPGGTAHFSPDGKSFAAGGRFGHPIYDIHPPRNLIIHTDENYRCVRFSPDGIQLAFTYRSHLGIKPLNNGSQRCWNTGYQDPLKSLDFSPDGKRLVFATGNIASVCTIASQSEEIPLRGHEDEVTCVAWQPGGGLIATGSRDRTIRLWEATTGNCVGMIEHR